jgi:hypothetical protein
MMRSQTSTIVIIIASLAVLGSMALAEQDRYTLKIPDGLSLFRKHAGHPENGCVYRQGYHAIPEYARMGICPVGL